jgi:hypothetical protein
VEKVLTGRIHTAALYENDEITRRWGEVGACGCNVSGRRFDSLSGEKQRVLALKSAIARC